MAFWALAILFFAITFGPRFFSFMNFGYGFSDLGLYAQTLFGFSQNQFNPVIATFGRHFFQLRGQPIIFLLWPVSMFTMSPTVFLFIDEAALVATAALCARYAWQKTQSQPFSLGVFFTVLFSAGSMNALRSPAQIALWAQVPLVLFLGEYFQDRRPSRLGFYFFFLCAIDLHFSALGFLFVPLILLTQIKRWNFRRRLSSSLAVAAVTFFACWGLRIFGLKQDIDTQMFLQVHGLEILNWLIAFCFLPLLSVEACIFGVAVMCLHVGGAQDPIILVGVAAMGAVTGLAALDFKGEAVKGLFALALVVVTLYFEATAIDPYFQFWNRGRWVISRDNRSVHDMLAKIGPTSSVGASDTLSPHLAARLNMMTLASLAYSTILPDYIVSRNEPTRFDHDSRYELVENNVSTGTRLLKRNK